MRSVRGATGFYSTRKTYSATNYRCQKCLEKGHFTYECKGRRKHVTRVSRTALLKNQLENVKSFEKRKLIQKWLKDTAKSCTGEKKVPSTSNHSNSDSRSKDSESDSSSSSSSSNSSKSSASSSSSSSSTSSSSSLPSSPKKKAR